MKRILFFIVISALAVSLINVALCEEQKDKDKSKEEGTVKISGKAIAGGEALSEQERSSKFFEYRDVPKGFVFKYFNFNVEKDDMYFTMTAKNVRQADSNYVFSLGKYGKYTVDVIFDRVPHRFSFDGKTLYVEPHPGLYTIADQIQRDAENAGSAAKALPLIASFLTGAHDTPLELQRDKATVNFNYTVSVPLRFNMNISNEQRSGTRPLGASFGFNLANEVPEPIDFRTTNVNTSLEYTKNWGTIRGGYFASSFDNSVEELIWENPYRLTDRTYEGAYSPGDATSRGRMALAPSNFAHKFYANASFKVFKNSRLNASVSFGQFRQDAKLLPFTINTALEEEYAHALEAPATSADAKANVGSVNLNFNTKLAKNIHLNAGFNYYNFTNHTKEFDFEGYSRFDQVWEFVPVVSEAHGFQPTKIFGDVTFNVIKNSSIKVGYSFYSIKRKIGEEEEGKSDEGTVRVAFDSAPKDWLNVRLSYSHGNRNWSLEGEEIIYAPGFNFKRYHEADRNRDAVNLLVDIIPNEKFDVAFSYMLGNDKYPNSDYGLKKNDFTMYGVDLGYNLKENATVYVFYYHETYKGEQASRQSGASFSTRTIDDWTANIKDAVNTAGCGFTAPIKKDKLNFDIYYAYSKAKGTADLFSPPGGTPDVPKPFINGIDTTTSNTAKVKLTWKINPHFATGLGYWYEQYDLDDIVRNDQKVSVVNSIYLGALEPSYTYHVGFMNFICSW